MRRQPKRSFTLAAAALVLAGAGALALLTRLPLYLSWLASATLVGLALHALDKLAAVRATARVPEVTLLLLSLAGGALGGLGAMLLLRHKTRHLRFWAVNLLGLALHAALVCHFVLHVV